MSSITYNGITMNLVKTNAVEREPIHSSDKTTYLYTRWTHDFIAVINPQLNSFNSDFAAKTGLMPAVIDRNIRHVLGQLRRTYIWEVGTDQVIRSPRVGDTTDMLNGPIPEVVSIQAINGVRSWIIHMRITTYINECETAAGEPSSPVILSHQWRPLSEIDQDHYTTRVIEGEAEFNIPALLNESRVADNYRINFGHPIPQNFQRIGCEVAISSNGANAHYRITDREMPMNLGSNCPGTRVEAIESYGWEGTGALGYAFAAAEGALSSALTAVQYSSGSVAPGTALASVPISAGVGAFRGVISVLPKFVERCEVRVWGNRISRKSDLLLYASEIAFNRIGEFDPAGAKTTSFTALLDVAGKFASFTLEHKYGAAALIPDAITQIDASLLTNAGPILAARGRRIIATGQRFTGGLDGIRNKSENVSVSGGRGIKNDVGFGNPSFNRSGGTRGTWLQKLVTQSLLEPCAGPLKATMISLWNNAPTAEVNQ